MNPTAPAYNPPTTSSPLDPEIETLDLRLRLDALSTHYHDLTTHVTSLQSAYTSLPSSVVSSEDPSISFVLRDECFACLSSCPPTNKRSRRAKVRLQTLLATLGQMEQQGWVEIEKGCLGQAGESVVLGEQVVRSLWGLVYGLEKGVQMFEGLIREGQSDESGQSVEDGKDEEEDEDDVVFILERPEAGGEKERRWSW